MKNTEEVNVTFGEAKMSAYRFLAGAQCSDTDLLTVRVLLRYAALVLSEDPVGKAAKKAITNRIDSTNDRNRKAMFACALGACGALCQASLDYAKANTDKELN